MQIAQNEGLRKLTGVFKMTPIDPLHNLTHIPLIPYLMGKLMHSYTLRIQALPPNTKVHTILSHDQCRYWPDYVHPPTNLSRASSYLRKIPETHRAPAGGTPEAWAHPLLVHLPSPPPHIISQHKESMARQEAADTHILLYYTPREKSHLASYFIHRQNTTLTKGVIRGADHMQAICRAVQATLTVLETTPTPHTHIFIWLSSQTLCDRILTHSSHRDLFPTRELHTQFETILLTQPHTLHLHTFNRKWPGTPNQAELRSLDPELLAAI
jgi:hypothetical protein